MGAHMPVANCRVVELRKDKADRNPGGVTPGDEAYYAAVQRAAGPAPAGHETDFGGYEPGLANGAAGRREATPDMGADRFVSPQRHPVRR